MAIIRLLCLLGFCAVLIAAGSDGGDHENDGANGKEGENIDNALEPENGVEEAPEAPEEPETPEEPVAPEAPQEPETEKSESSEEHPEEGEHEEHEPHWGYKGDYRPDMWWKLKPLCAKESARQSPIDIDTKQTIFDDELSAVGVEEVIDRRYKHMVMVNNGHSVNVQVPHEARVTGGNLPGHGYHVAGVHFHWGSEDDKGSEHTFGSKYFPLEMHMVTYDTERASELGEAVFGDNTLAVLGTIFQLSEEDNPKLNKIISNLKHVQEPGSERKIPHFALNDLLPINTNKYYRYYGSLTTPPCAESVVWTLFLHTNTISASQLKEFRNLVGSREEDVVFNIVDNYRPIQEIYDRVVYRSFLFKSEMSKAVIPHKDVSSAHGSATQASLGLATLLSLILAMVL